MQKRACQGRGVKVKGQGHDQAANEKGYIFLLFFSTLCVHVITPHYMNKLFSYTQENHSYGTRNATS